MTNRKKRARPNLADPTTRDSKSGPAATASATSAALTTSATGRFPDGVATRISTRAQVLLLIAISLAAYGLTLRNGFVTDDHTQILLNPNVKDSVDVGRIFSADVWSFSTGKGAGEGASNYYRPLQILVYAGEYEVFGNRPWGWHAVNLALNSAVVVAAYFLIAMLGGAELAFWSALLFALHPMHVEAVAWIAALPELQCGLLMIVAMIFYHRARSGGNPAWNIAISTFAFLAALLSKETALLFPVILFAYEYFYRGEALTKLWKSLRWIWPYLVALQVYIIARVLALGAFTPVYQFAREPLSLAQVIFAVPAVLARYVGKLAAPVGMNYFYAFPMPKNFGWWTLVGFAVTAAVAAGMFALRKSEPLLPFCVAWFLLTLAPAMNLNHIGENFFTERYLYIPSLGFCVIVAWIWLWVRQRTSDGVVRWATVGAGIALVAFYVAQVERRIPFFRDDMTLLTDAARQSPESGAVHAQLAGAYFERGDSPKAIAEMTRALELKPAQELDLVVFAQYLTAEKRYDEAVERLKQAIAKVPDYEVPRINLAKIYTDRGQWPEAAQIYRELEAVDSKNAAYYTQLAALADANGNVAGEIDRTREELDREPHDTAALVRLGDSYAHAARWAEAAGMLRRAAKEKPDSVEIWTKLGICLNQSGDQLGAIDAFQHALALNPDSLLAHKYISEPLAALGRFDESSAQLELILAKDPGYERADEVHYALGLNFEKKGDNSRAASEFQKALSLNPNFTAAEVHLEKLRGSSSKRNSK